jgi:hypothetical protein
MTKKTLPLVIAAIILAIAVIYFTRSGGNNNLSPSSSQSASPTPAISASPTPTPKPSTKPTPVGYIIPKCWLGGEITFENNVFKTADAYFNYEQVTDHHDFIRWTITPGGEDVSIGPNMFASLGLPSGRDTISINFNSGKPKYAEYTLKASIDYPVELPEGGKVLNTACSSETKLIIK